ncbi:chemotaxis protein CheD [Desulfonatronovibrio hydrogenovorans]|uniref:chemotaxis protein CheD n=1 Tax=Desulfonatronovibrio hydrogenovorans TaxID=53245 RepID=UPI00048DE068|nr:chemotaxis protein CheD [Desulfonatronovibrio hydrogenovorans]
MRKHIHIHIGECRASREPAVLHTILGSCVAVCLFDSVRRIGGMNHILLPGKADLKKFDVSARYGVNAMEILINEMMKLGAARKDFIAKAFGGAHMIPSISRDNGVGRKIASFVLEFLRNEHIRIVSSDLGGVESRKILFYTDTGEVFLKRVPSGYVSRLAQREQAESARIRQESQQAGDITLFDK